MEGRAKRHVGPDRLPAPSDLAAVNRLGRDYLDAHAVLARRLENARFRKTESISARNHVHHFRVSGPDELDAEVRTWLREAYQVGRQRHPQ